MEKDEQIIAELVKGIDQAAESFNKIFNSKDNRKEQRMTREEMIEELVEYCKSRNWCDSCALDKYSPFLCDNSFGAMSDKELEKRMTLIKAENRLHQAEAQLGFKFNMSQCDERRDHQAKADAGKAPISLVPMEIIWAIAWIRKYGNEKYGDPDNWKTVEPERYRDALMRHILHYISDPKSVDEESGYPHLWHAACNMAFLMNMDYGDRVYSGDTFEALRWKGIGKSLSQGFKEGLTDETTN